VDPWEKLIAYFADKNHPICNCGEAYYEKGTTNCRHGCSANQFDAKRYIAKKVLKLLPKK